MATLTARIVLKKDLTPQVRAALRTEVAAAVRNQAGVLQQRVKRYGHRLTSSMVQSVYRSTDTGSDYGPACSSAKALNRRVRLEPEAARPSDGPDHATGIVGVAAFHALVEEGLIPSPQGFRSGHDFLGRAAQDSWEGYQRAVRRAVDRAAP